MPIKGIDHIDLAVRDAERSPAFCLGVPVDDPSIGLRLRWRRGRIAP